MLMLAGAFVMMVLAAPGHVQGRPHSREAARPSAHHGRGSSVHVEERFGEDTRAPDRAAAGRAWAEAYMPAMISKAGPLGTPVD